MEITLIHYTVFLDRILAKKKYKYMGLLLYQDSNDVQVCLT